jgi:predicted nucleic-acid-binding protein
MKIGDKIKTTAWLEFLNENDYLEGKVHQIINQNCLDGSIFEKIYVKFDDGRILPCIREELEVINS